MASLLVLAFGNRSWWPMVTKRIEFTTKIKVAASKRANGRCEQCGGVLKKAEHDHRIPLAMGGESTLENCVVLCVQCHAEKTRKADIPAIAKAKRREAKHIGADAPMSTIPARPFQSRLKPEKADRLAASHRKHKDAMEKKVGA